MKWRLTNRFVFDEPGHMQRWELERQLRRLHQQINQILDAYNLDHDRKWWPVLDRLRRKLSEVKAQLASMEEEQVG
jgi:hypothetical protein